MGTGARGGSKRVRVMKNESQEAIKALGPEYQFALIFEIFEGATRFAGDKNVLQETIDSIVLETKKIEWIGPLAVDIIITHYNKEKWKEGRRRSFDESFLDVTSGGGTIFDLDNDYLERIDIRNLVDRNKSDDQVDAEAVLHEENEMYLDFYEKIRVIKKPEILEQLTQLIDYWSIMRGVNTTPEKSVSSLGNFGMFMDMDAWEVTQFLLDCQSSSNAKEGVVQLENSIFNVNLMLHAIHFDRQLGGGSQTLVEKVLEEANKLPEDFVTIERSLSMCSYLPLELALKRQNTRAMTQILFWLKMRWAGSMGLALPDFWPQVRDSKKSTERHILYEIMRQGDESVLEFIFQTNYLTAEIMTYLQDEEDLPANQNEQDRQAQEITPRRKEEAYDKLWESGTMLLQTPQFDIDLLEYAAFHCPINTWRMILLDLRTNMDEVDMYTVVTALIFAQEWEYVREVAMIEKRMYTMANSLSAGEMKERTLALTLETAFKELGSSKLKTRRYLGKWGSKYLQLYRQNKPQTMSMQQYYDFLSEQVSNIFLEEQLD